MVSKGEGTYMDVDGTGNGSGTGNGGGCIVSTGRGYGDNGIDQKYGDDVTDWATIRSGGGNGSDEGKGQGVC